MRVVGMIVLVSAVLGVILSPEAPLVGLVAGEMLGLVVALWVGAFLTILGGR